MGERKGLSFSRRSKPERRETGRDLIPKIAPMSSTAATLPRSSQPAKTSFRVLGAISTAHLINDMMQSLIVAIYPVLKGEFSLSFTQIGLISLTYQLTASLFQPLVGLYTDKRPVPYSLPVGMTFTLSGLVLLAWSPNFAL